MPSMKVEGDSDGDLSGVETERSGGSSGGPDRDSSAEEADEPDSDDSSEMDESECERRRNDCLDNLANIERQFLVLREKLYVERSKHIEKQLFEVKGGKSQEYLRPLRRLQENMNIRIEVAGVVKRMRIENIQHTAAAEEQSIHQNYKDQKKSIYRSMKENILQKIKALEEKKELVNFGCPNGQETGRRKRKRQVTVSHPYVVYMLPDADIMEDWRLFKKLLEKGD